LQSLSTREPAILVFPQLQLYIVATITFSVHPAVPTVRQAQLVKAFTHMHTLDATACGAPILLTIGASEDQLSSYNYCTSDKVYQSKHIHCINSSNKVAMHVYIPLQHLLAIFEH
jgi:hypothetical protein